MFLFLFILPLLQTQKVFLKHRPVPSNNLFFGRSGFSKNRPPSGHLRLKNPVWRVKKILLAYSLVTESCRLADGLETKLFFKADNADAGRTWRCLSGSLCRSKMQGSWPFGPIDRVCEKSTPRILVPSLRPSELIGAEKISHALWLSIFTALQSSTWVFFSSGLSGESAPICIGTGETSVRRKRPVKEEEFEEEGSKEDGVRRQQQRGGKFRRASVRSYTYTRITCRYG